MKDEDKSKHQLLLELAELRDRKSNDTLLKNDLSKTTLLLSSIHKAQNDFLMDSSHENTFNDLLATLLDLTQSEYGFIGEVHYKENVPYLKTHAITDISWNEETKLFYQENAPEGLEFRNLESLFGQVMVTGKPVIADDPKNDTRSAGLPKGHPPLNRFLGIPFYKGEELIGMVGVANFKGSHGEDIIEFLTPFLSTCCGLIWSIKLEYQRNQIQEQLVRSQKMEALGTLAGGIAHDFNNILTSIIGNADMATIHTPNDSKAMRNLEAISKASERAASMIKQILTFSRMEAIKLEPVDLKSVLSDTVSLIRTSIPTNIKIYHNTLTDCPFVMADKTQIYQVLLNLCTNAYHAMTNDSGVIEINLEVWNTSNQSKLECPNTIMSGEYVKLTVIDNGCGISEEHKDKIFDPFYTTKDIGIGTGLGLSVVYSIVDSFKGIIRIESEVGKGTMVSIYLPTTKGLVIKEPVPKQNIRSSGGHILLVDDESDILELYREVLEEFGYTVSAFSNARSAFEFFRSDPYSIDLVITDQSMPSMTGKQLIKKLLVIRSDLKIILSTGYMELDNSDNKNNLKIKKYLVKPFNISTLHESIEECLQC